MLHILITLPSENQLFFQRKHKMTEVQLWISLDTLEFTEEMKYIMGDNWQFKTVVQCISLINTISWTITLINTVVQKWQQEQQPPAGCWGQQAVGETFILSHSDSKRGTRQGGTIPTSFILWFCRERKDDLLSSSMDKSELHCSRDETICYLHCPLTRDIHCNIADSF